MNPEMLLFLAERMGLPRAELCEAYEYPRVIYSRGWETLHFRPHTDRAQFADVVIWAAMEGMGPHINDKFAEAGYFAKYHDSTPSGIMAATVEAIARAAGWEE